MKHHSRRLGCVVLKAYLRSSAAINPRMTSPCSIVALRTADSPAVENCRWIVVCGTPPEQRKCAGLHVRKRRYSRPKFDISAALGPMKGGQLSCEHDTAFQKFTSRAASAPLSIWKPNSPNLHPIKVQERGQRVRSPEKCHPAQAGSCFSEDKSERDRGS